MKTKWLAVFTILMMCLLSVYALADGDSEWLRSRFNNYIQLASHVGDYDGWLDISGLGGVTLRDGVSVRVISRNASIWAQPRTNSKKLGTAKNGEDLACEITMWNNEAVLVQENGFYAVSYKGTTGWINEAYVVYAPYEIVLMEGNVPAFCAPDHFSKRVGSLNKLTRYTVLGFYEDFYVINLREAAAYVPMSVAHYDSDLERLYHGGMEATAVVAKKTVMRTGPGNGYASVRDIKAGQKLTCLDEIEGWYLIQDHDTGCYTYIWSGDAQLEWR